MNKLKACPFCGTDKARIIEHKFHDLNNTFGVMCINCKAQSYQFYDTEEEAVGSWNMRVTIIHRSGTEGEK